jgi:hypothetical protein
MPALDMHPVPSKLSTALPPATHAFGVSLRDRAACVVVTPYNRNAVLASAIINPEGVNVPAIERALPAFDPHLRPPEAEIGDVLQFGEDSHSLANCRGLATV